MQVCELISAGKLKPTIAKVFPLQAAPEAHSLLETGHVRGKLVLDVEALKA
jgi:NADPH:quinone reductase-like Zn-dependent oxidoreductase